MNFLLKVSSPKRHMWALGFSAFRLQLAGLVNNCGPVFQSHDRRARFFVRRGGRQNMEVSSVQESCQPVMKTFMNLQNECFH